MNKGTTLGIDNWRGLRLVPSRVAKTLVVSLPRRAGVLLGVEVEIISFSIELVSFNIVLDFGLALSSNNTVL